jgi:hypothetical protein
MLGMPRFRLGCMRLTGESTRTSLISPASPSMPYFQRFTVVVNNMRANVDVLPYDDHDRAVKLLHLLVVQFGVESSKPLWSRRSMIL